MLDILVCLKLALLISVTLHHETPSHHYIAAIDCLLPQILAFPPLSPLKEPFILCLPILFLQHNCGIYGMFGSAAPTLDVGRAM